MKTVWILNHYAQKPGGPGSTRHYSLARHLKKRGWQTVIIASSAEHGTGKQRIEGNNRVQLEDVDGVRFCWVRSPSYRGNGFWRILNIAAYTISVLVFCRTWKLPRPDIIIGSSVHPLAALVGQRLARRFCVPFVFEVRDLWPETLIAMGAISRNGIIAKLMRWLEKYLYQNASSILVLLPKAIDYIGGLGIDRQKVYWLPNGTDVELFKVRHKEVGASDIFTFMYFGSHGKANRLEPIIRAFAALLMDKENPSCQMRFIGDGPLKSELISLTEELEIEKYVSFEPSVFKAQIPQIAAQADAFVVNIGDLPIYRYGISLNKIFDYLAAAKPIIFSGNSINNPVSDAGAGISVSADNVREITVAMKTLLLATPEERSSMGKRGFSYVESNFSYQHLSKELADVLENVLQEKNHR